MLRVAFCDSDDKNAVAQTVSGGHVEDDRAEDNAVQTDYEVFNRK